MSSKSKREGRIMKKAFYFIPVILLAAACQQMEIVNPAAPAQQESTSCFLTIHATKGTPETKALDLVNDGATLNAYWKDGETVKVYKSGTFLGALDVTPGEGSKPTTATLSGSITTAGLALNDALLLIIPHETWDYTGQNGLLTGENSIEQKYAYATASVNVTDINGSTVSTTNASFTNAESMYRFGFMLGENHIDPKSFTVSSAGNKLVQSMSWSGSAWTPAYGGLTITPASAAGDHFYYVSIRNDQTTDDVYNFTITGSDDALYMASKTIPASVLDAPKFISAKSITVTQPSFAPVSGEISNSANVL